MKRLDPKINAWGRLFMATRSAKRAVFQARAVCEGRHVEGNIPVALPK